MTDRYLALYMVRHMAEDEESGADSTKPDTSSAFGRYWSEYYKPFQREFQAAGKPGFNYRESFGRLSRERPKSLLGLGGLTLAGLMGGTSGVPRWLLGLGLGGVGAGYLYQNRDKIGEWAGRTLGKSFMTQMDEHMKANMGSYAQMLYKAMAEQAKKGLLSSIPFVGNGQKAPT